MNLDDVLRLVPDTEEQRTLKNYRLGENMSLLSKTLSVNFFETIYRHPLFKKYDFISKLNTVERRIITNCGSSEEPFNIKTLSRHVGAKQKSMHYPLKSLQRQGLIEMYEGDYDKRETLVKITEKGRKMLKDYNAATFLAEAEVFKFISDEEMDELNKVLFEVRATIEKFFPLPDPESDD